MNLFKNRYQQLFIISLLLFIFFRSQYFLFLSFASSYFNFIYYVSAILFILFVFLLSKLVVASETEPFLFSTTNILILFIFCFIYFRLPFLFANLEYEDSIIAEILLGRCQKPDLWFLGRFEGKNISMLIMHPTLCLDILATLFTPFDRIDFYQLSDLKTSVLLRSIFSLCSFLSGVLLLIFYFQVRKPVYATNKVLIGIVIICFFNSRFFIYTSVMNPHIDSTFGVISACIFTLCIAMYFDKRHQFYYLFISSIVFAFGKQEWSCLILFACFVYFILDKLSVFSTNEVKAQNTRSVFAIATGIISGNVISLCYDTKNYIGGLVLLFKMALVHAPIFQLQSTKILFKYYDTPVLMDNRFSPSFETYLNSFLQKAEITYPLIVLLVISTYLLISKRESINRTSVFLYICSLALYVPFFLSSWFLDRYFCPAFLFSIATLTSIISYTEIKKIEYYSIVILSVVVIYLSSNIMSINITALKKHTSAFYFENDVKDDMSSNTDCINIVDVTINKPASANIFIRSFATVPDEIFFKQSDYKVCEQSEKYFRISPK